MSSLNDNKQLITRYLEALSGKPKSRNIVERFVSDLGLVEHINQVEAAFPCYELVAEEIMAERDLVVVRGVFHGVHRGTFAGIEPTGRTASAGLMIIYRIANGRIANHWLQFDLFSLVSQLKEPALAH
jgi:predicted ester cyclase